MTSAGWMVAGSTCRPLMGGGANNQVWATTVGMPKKKQKHVIPMIFITVSIVVSVEFRNDVVTLMDTPTLNFSQSRVIGTFPNAFFLLNKTVFPPDPHPPYSRVSFPKFERAS